jgi:tricorn protease-like protein
VDTGGVIKIMDFGIARSVSAETTLTIAGTPAYMAPEQAEGKPADQRSDIYSFGLILYEMFTGTPAFSDASAFARLAKSSHEGGPAPPREVEPNVPEWLEAVILQCLEKETEKRFQSVDELDAFLSAPEPKKLPSSGASPAQGEFHFARFASGAAAVVVLAFAAGLLVGHYWQAGQARMHHKKAVHSVAFGLGGKWLASGSEDHTIKIWSIPDQREVRTLGGHTGSVNSVAFSPDGGFLASGSTDKTVKVWNVGTWIAEHTLRGHAAQVISVAFSRDGRVLASGSNDGTVKVWDVKAGKELVSLKAHEVGVTAVAFSGDGKILASCDTEGKIKLRDPATGTETRTFADSDEVLAMAFGPDSQLLGSGGSNRIIKLWDVATGRANDLDGHTDTVNAVAFSPDGRWLVSGSDDETIRLWDVATGKQTRILTLNTGGVSDLCISSKGGYLAWGNGGGDVRLLQVKELR